MAAFERTYRVGRTPEQVFEVIGTNLYRNHPRWEPEVIEIRPLTDGPLRVGSRAVMVRKDGRRRSEVIYEITAFEPGRRVTSIHPGASMDFELTFDLAPVESSATDLTVRVRMTPHGLLRVIEPLMTLQLPSRSERLSRSMVRLVEAETPPA